MKRLIILIIALSLFTASCSFFESGAAGENNPLPEKLKYPPVSNEKPKIIAFGDSLTAGFGLSEKESYPYLLQKKLVNAGYDYEVVNAGVSGDTSLGGLERIDWVLGQENVEILILELGANDLLRGVPVSEMKSNLEKIVEKAQKKGVRVLLCGMLAPPTMGRDYQRDFLNAFPEIATKYDIAFLPFILENVALEKELNQADGIHPNAKGTAIMTENVFAELKPMLDNKAR